MTKEEMKNRISMALKDPILQQGFEIICKENAELKKELEKAEEKINILDNCDRLGDVITNAYKQQLTEAKEIIREYKNICNNAPFLSEEEVELKEKAEAFLKESE